MQKFYVPTPQKNNKTKPDHYLIMLTTVAVISIAVFSLLAVRAKDLLYASIYLAAVSVMVSVVFVILQAPDIAMTEAAVGAGLSTFIFIAAVKKTERMEK